MVNGADRGGNVPALDLGGLILRCRVAVPVPVDHERSSRDRDDQQDDQDRSIFLEKLAHILIFLREGLPQRPKFHLPARHSPIR